MCAWTGSGLIMRTVAGHPMKPLSRKETSVLSGKAGQSSWLESMRWVPYSTCTDALCDADPLLPVYHITCVIQGSKLQTCWSHMLPNFNLWDLKIYLWCDLFSFPYKRFSNYCRVFDTVTSPPVYPTLHNQLHFIFTFLTFNSDFN